MTYTIIERARKIYTTVLDVFNYKKSSDVVTPLSVAKQQVVGIPVSAKVCVPGAGVGTYVVALLERGVAPENIVAVEFDPAYYELGSAMFERLGVCYVLADFLEWQPNMQFDVIVGNPPYQRSREVRNVGSPLWPDFIERSVELVRAGGVVSLVVPFTWMQKNARSKAWKVIKQNDLIALDPSVDWAFPGIDAGGITVITLAKQEYGGETRLPDGTVINILDPTPSNNREWNADAFEFMRTAKVMELDVRTGPINPSINSSHWSPVETETHCYEVFYSSAKNRRSMWCDMPIGDWGKLKLAVPTYGDIYGNIQITEVGCGRQVEYVLGERDELERIKAQLESEGSRRLNHLRAYGAYHCPLKNVIQNAV